MCEKIKKLILDCESQINSSYKLFEESRIRMEEGPPKARTTLDRNMELVDKVTDYIYETVITGGLELIYFLRENWKWIDEGDTLAEEDSDIVMKAFKDIDESIKVCSKEFLHLKSLKEYVLATDRKPEDPKADILDYNTSYSLSRIMAAITKPMSSISSARMHIIAMGKEKYGEAQK